MSRGFLTEIVAEVISPPLPTAAAIAETVCGCDFVTCFQEVVFADAAASGDYWKADKSDFLYKKSVTSDTVAFELWRNGIKVHDIDGTYGDFYNPPTGAALYVGFVADWTLIFAAFGGGKYQVKIQVTTFGNSFTLTSRDFRLYPYAPELAQSTVRIESYQTGNILSSNLDYSELLEALPNGWYSSIRIPGRFGNKTPSITTDEYLSTSYRVTQNRNQIQNNYTLETRILPESVSDRLTQNAILANSLLITDYDLYSSAIYRRKEVVPVAIDEVSHFQETSGAKYTVTFADRTQNIIKRNF